MDNDATIRFENVSKKYRITRGYRSMLGDVYEGIRNTFSSAAVGEHIPAEASAGEIWALNGVSFEMNRGEVVGIIGANGSGKTTILKLLSGITQPTCGTIGANGKIGALIEVGAGFHPELTGRENIYLNGSILGLKKRQIDQKFKQIVEFAEMGQFIDTPVKRYSSGMYVRLGFSVAVNTDPDILLIDEVLAVGDLQFQRRCLDKIGEFRGLGKTIVLVSHNLNHIRALTQKAMWLEHGVVKAEGSTSVVVNQYVDEVNRKSMHTKDEKDTKRSDPHRTGTGEIKFVSVRTLNSERKETRTFRTGETLVLEMKYRAQGTIKRPTFRVGIFTPEAITAACTCAPYIPFPPNAGKRAG